MYCLEPEGTSTSFQFLSGVSVRNLKNPGIGYLYHIEEFDLIGDRYIFYTCGVPIQKLLYIVTKFQ
jgi:hypothetical protein